MNIRLLQMPENRETQLLVEMAESAVAGAQLVMCRCSTREEVDEARDSAVTIITRLIGL